MKFKSRDSQFQVAQRRQIGEKNVKNENYMKTTGEEKIKFLALERIIEVG